MTLTPEERAAMVRDLESLAKKYAEIKTDHLTKAFPKTALHFESMALNYSALASALKEGLTFQGVA